MLWTILLYLLAAGLVIYILSSVIRTKSLTVADAFAALGIVIALLLAQNTPVGNSLFGPAPPSEIARAPATPPVGETQDTEESATPEGVFVAITGTLPVEQIPTFTPEQTATVMPLPADAVTGTARPQATPQVMELMPGLIVTVLDVRYDTEGWLRTTMKMENQTESDICLCLGNKWVYFLDEQNRQYELPPGFWTRQDRIADEVKAGAWISGDVAIDRPIASESQTIKVIFTIQGKPLSSDPIQIPGR